MFETLEARQLMAVTVGLDSAGNLNITSDTNGDTIVVTEQFGKATVTVGGRSVGSYSPTGRIKITGNGGNDTITYKGYSAGADILGGLGADIIYVYDYRTAPTVPSTVDCGAGIDKCTVYAGVGVVVHGGTENDTLTVAGGTNVKVYGDGGTDSIVVSSTSAKSTTIYKDSLDRITNKGTGTMIVLV